MALLKQMATKPCALAFSADGDYLAVGVRGLRDRDFPALRLLRTSASAYLSTEQLLGVAASYRSRAGFARVAWSKPGEGSSGGGLIAGGLLNGMVAVWDPVDLPAPRDSFEAEEAAPFLLEKTSGNLKKSQESEFSDLRDEEYSSVTMIPEYLDSRPDPVRMFLPKIKQQIDDFNGVNKMAALFSCHAKPVNSLCFSPHAPRFLLSGATEGKIVIWDLAQTDSDTIPMTELHVTKAELTFASWSPSMDHVIATTTSAGETIVLDVRTKKETARHRHNDDVLSCVQWAPFNPSELLTAATSSSLPFKLWDVREMTKPVKAFGNEISGANSICFCPLDSDSFLASTDDDIYTWSLKDCQIKGQLLCKSTCGEVHYRPESEELLVASTEDGVKAYRWEVIDNSGCPDLIE